ncbi:MAG: glycine oxidase ThiO [Deltaproteobacteria bacterium]|nr:glycine oxidase ThiO [Deltaproteobacteria bacterium]
MGSPDVLIIGGGIIGLSIARRLAMDGVSVEIFDRQQPGMEASWAAAGMLAPQMEVEGPGPFLDLCLWSRDLYLDFVKGLQEDSGISIPYNAEGMVSIALTEEDETGLRERYAWQKRAGLPVEWLSAPAIRERVPTVTSDLRGGLFFPGHHRLDHRQIIRALLVDLQKRGVKTSWGVAAHSILVQRSKAIGVETSQGSRCVGKVVVAAGSWSSQLQYPNEEIRPKVRPIRGQVVSVEYRGAPFPYSLFSSVGYLVPRSDGQMLLGTTVEEVGYDKSTTVSGIQKILSGAMRLIPSISDCSITEAWAGLRPRSDDFLPVLGASSVENLYFATGHFRNGILLTPATAEILGELIRMGRSSFPIETFQMDRWRRHALASRIAL